MTGRIRTVIGAKSFGFINVEGNDYFFHKADFIGHWDDLRKDFDNGDKIEVVFRPLETPKGLRASDVKRLDWPNQAA